MFGNLAQGFSVSWWKDKHNRHHAVPNVHGGPGGSLFADPAVATMPLLAWWVAVVVFFFFYGFEIIACAFS